MNDFLKKLLEEANGVQLTDSAPIFDDVQQSTDAERNAMLTALVKEMPANNSNGLGQPDPQPTAKGQANRPPAAMKFFGGPQPETPQIEPVLAQQEPPARQPSTTPVSMPEMNLLDTLVPTQKPNAYEQSLKERDDLLSKALILEGANQIGAGIAGGKNVFNAKAIRDQAELPTKDYFDKFKASNEAELNDANSDISKFSQERALDIIKKINPDSPLLSKVSSMTATQLKSVFGDKLSTGTLNEKDRFVSLQGILSNDGYPLVRNERTGRIYIAGTDEEYDVREGTSSQYAKVIDDQFGNKTKYDSIANKTTSIFAPKTELTKLPEKKQETVKIIAPEDDAAYLDELRTVRGTTFKKLDEVRDTVSKDSEFKKLEDAVASIDASKALVEANKPGSAPMLARALLTIYESGGRFTDADVEQMKGPTDLKARMNRFLVTNFDANQAVSDIDQAAQLELLKILEIKKIEQLSKKFVPLVNTLAKDRIDKDVAARYLTGDRVQTFNELSAPRKLDSAKKQPTVVIREINGIKYKFDAETKQNLGKAE